MSIETPEDVEALRRVGAAVAQARDAMARAATAGVTTADLDAIGGDVLRRHGARSAPRLAYGFPGETCISVNDALAHGIPSEKTVLRDGDVVNVDVSAELDGYWADSGMSLGIGSISPRLRELLAATRAALAEAMLEARAGRPLRNIGRAVQSRARRHGFHVVADLCGHGVGRHIHEPPSVPNVFHAGLRGTLAAGQVLTIEPFLTTRATSVVEDADGWTLRTPDGSVGAQFEHTFIVTEGAPIVLTTL